MAQLRSATGSGLRYRSRLGEYLNALNLLGAGAEIGVHTGQFAETLLRTWKGRKLSLVDPWRNLKDYLDSFNASDAVMERRYQLARRRLREFADRTSWIRSDSKAAAKLFAVESLDFVYIDANHAYEHALQDLQMWYTKVRRGGIIAGHDYFDAIADASLEPGRYGTYPRGKLTSYGVRSAVDEFTSDLGVTVATTIEKYPTWYFLK